MAKKIGICALICLGAFYGVWARGADLLTNHVRMVNPPAWVKAREVRKLTDKVQNFMEWDIRRVDVHWVSDPTEFRKMHGLGDGVRAYATRGGKTLYLGPTVTRQNFDGVFLHELTHVISFQKYKDSIPPWLEEGLANYVAGRKVDYSQLDGEHLPSHSQLVHPFSQKDPAKVYLISTALMEFIANRCDLHDLLQLSVGKKLETYLSTSCEISDLDGDFRQWVGRKKKAQSKK